MTHLCERSSSKDLDDLACWLWLYDLESYTGQDKGPFNDFLQDFEAGLQGGVIKEELNYKLWLFAR